MALTTGSAQKITDSTQSAGPRKRTVEADILFDKSIVARPLNAPEVASIHVKKTEYYYRWVNRLHGHGQVMMQRKAMGFTNATTDDVEVLVGDTVSNENEIFCNDLILMKIPFHLWAGHVKRNMTTAQTLQSVRGVYNSEEELSGDVFAEGGRSLSDRGSMSTVSKDIKGKINSFIPSDPDAIMNNQSDDLTAKVKEEVSDIRKRIAAERSKAKE
jgi:hypothetical protein